MLHWSLRFTHLAPISHEEKKVGKRIRDSVKVVVVSSGLRYVQKCLLLQPPLFCGGRYVRPRYISQREGEKAEKMRRVNIGFYLVIGQVCFGCDGMRFGNHRWNITVPFISSRSRIMYFDHSRSSTLLRCHTTIRQLGAI